jgi:hypothetical protein
MRSNVVLVLGATCGAHRSAVWFSLFLSLLFGGLSSSCERKAAEASNRGPSATGRQGLVTTEVGPQYVAQCIAQGVPLPTTVHNSSWVNHGEIEDEFESPEYEAELWSWTDPAGEGICLSLPRWIVDQNDPDVGKSRLFGIICLGTSGKACFFDNANNRRFDRNVAYPFSEWIGGAALFANAQGVCTDCLLGRTRSSFTPKSLPSIAILVSCPA